MVGHAAGFGEGSGLRQFNFRMARASWITSELSRRSAPNAGQVAAALK